MNLTKTAILDDLRDRLRVCRKAMAVEHRNIHPCGTFSTAGFHLSMSRNRWMTLKWEINWLASLLRRYGRRR